MQWPRAQEIPAYLGAPGGCGGAMGPASWGCLAPLVQAAVSAEHLLGAKGDHTPLSRVLATRGGRPVRKPSPDECPR